MKKANLSLIGLLQALGVIIYCFLISLTFLSLNRIMIRMPDLLGPVLMLVLLVFSVAITGALVFGYSVYLALDKKIKQALSVLAYTLLYCLGFMEIIVIILLINF